MKDNKSIVKLLSLTVLILLSFYITKAFSQSGVKHMSLIKGKCTNLIVGSFRYECAGVILTTHENGRISFSIPIPKGAVSFSGGKSKKTDSRTYALKVDNVSVGSAKKTVRYKVDGLCEMVVDANEDFVRSVVCFAAYNGKAVALNFVGDGSPIKHMN